MLNFKGMGDLDEQRCFDAGGHIFDTGGGDRYEGGNLDPLDEFSGEFEEDVMISSVTHCETPGEVEWWPT